jgi:hypothetical protein
MQVNIAKILDIDYFKRDLTHCGLLTKIFQNTP